MRERGIKIALALIFLAGCGGGEKRTTTNLPPVLILEKHVIKGEIDEVIYPSAVSSYDPEGEQVHFYWSIKEAPLNSVNPLLFDRASPTPAFIPDVPGKYVLSLTADDGVNVSGPEGVTVSVSEELLKPSAVLKRKSPVKLGESVELTGDFSADPSGESLSYYWTMVSAPSSSTATLSVTSAPSTSFIPDVPHGTYVVQLTVYNRFSLMDSKTVELTVENNPPSIDLKVKKEVYYYKSVTVNAGTSYTFVSPTSDADEDSNFTYTFSFTFSSYNSELPQGAGFYCPSEGQGYRPTCTTSDPSVVEFYTGNNPNFEGSFLVSVTAADSYGGRSADIVILERSAQAPPEISVRDTSTGHIYSGGYYRLYDYGSSSPPNVQLTFKNTNSTSQTLTYLVRLKERPSTSCAVDLEGSSGSIDIPAGESRSVNLKVSAYGSDPVCVGTYRFSVKACFLSKCAERDFSVIAGNGKVSSASISVPQKTFNLTCETDADGRRFSREKVQFTVFASGVDPDGDPLYLNFSAAGSSGNANGISFSPSSVECPSGAECSTEARLSGRDVCVKKELRCVFFIVIFCSTVCTQVAHDVLVPGRTSFQVQAKDAFSSGPSSSTYVEVKCR